MVMGIMGVHTFPKGIGLNVNVIVVGVLGTIPKGLKTKILNKLEIRGRMETDCCVLVSERL